MSGWTSSDEWALLEDEDTSTTDVFKIKKTSEKIVLQKEDDTNNVGMNISPQRSSSSAQTQLWEKGTENTDGYFTLKMNDKYLQADTNVPTVYTIKEPTSKFIVCYYYRTQLY